MVQYREILRLHSLGYSQRSIEASVGSSHQTVGSVLSKAKAQHISWPLDDDITDAMLEKLLGSASHATHDKAYAVPDYEYIHKELSKKGVTLTLLWEEYCTKCRANGETPYMSTQFGDNYRRWRDEGLHLPIVEEFFGEGNPDRTVLTLPLVTTQNTNVVENGTVFDTENDTVNDTDMYSADVQDYLNKCPNKKRTTALKLIKFIMDNSHITVTDMAQKHGVSESTIKRYLKDFQVHGILKRSGSDKNGEWILI